MRQTRIASAFASSLLMLCACSGPEHSNIFDGDGTNGTVGTGGIGGSTSTVTTANDSTSDTSTTVTSGGPTVTSSTSSTAVGGSGSGGGSTNGTGGGNSTATSDGGTGGDSSTAATTDGGTAGTGGSGTGGTGTGGTGTGGDGGNSCTPSEEVCDGHDNDCNNAVDDGDVCPVGCRGASFEGHAYMFCDAPAGANGTSRPARSWQQAMQFCMNHSQLLVRVESEAENAFVYQSLNESDGTGDVWMGATDQEDEDAWMWAVSSEPDDWVLFYDANDREPVDGAFVDWRQGEPNDMDGEDCGVFEDQEGGTWLWDDRSCSTDFDRLVCEDPD